MNTAIAIRAYREHQGLTQAQFAHQIGVTQGLIGHYESGRKLPSAKAAIRIEQATRGGLPRATLRPDLFE